MVDLLLCYRRHYYWRQPWRSTRVLLFFAFNLGADFCCRHCILGFRYVIGALTCFGTNENSCTPLQRPLCMSVICFFASFGMMLNISARLSNAAWCVSFKITNCAAVTVFFNASIKSHAAIVAASAEEILGVFTLCGKFHNVGNALRSCICCKNSITPLLF